LGPRSVQSGDTPTVGTLTPHAAAGKGAWSDGGLDYFTTATVAVAGAECKLSIIPTGQRFPAGGGSDSFQVKAPAGCPWTPNSDKVWIVVKLGGSRIGGDGTVTYSVDSNDGPQERTGTITIAGIAFTVTQDGTAPKSPCSEQQVAGGDTPETHTIEMGQSSGTFTFYYNTYEIPDQMIVTYQGTVLLDTGCVGQEHSVELTYSGTATTIVVRVNPNCNGSTSGTAWTFTVGCPK
ncbi:MAG: BACON domain-containing protein, partial [Acidobacteriota bacterium]|nr:BACON domain-containing protein [Acidobacteriota bacterium]